MERVGVVVHPSRPVVDALAVLRRWTEDRDLGLVQIPNGEQPPVAPAGEVRACDLIVALGGDGTILKALHAAARTQTPVLGVAYGSLGALTAVPADELETGLDRFAAGDWRPRSLPALAVRADGRQIASAINDLVIERGRGTQLLLDVQVNGELYARVAGDGVVVATPLGSSAYAMAAGGAVLTEQADSFICVPLAMHGGSAPPVVVDGEGEVSLEVRPGFSGFHIDVDGSPRDTDASMFAVTREQAYTTLVSLDQSETGLSRLRARGLIADSPRVARDRREDSTASDRLALPMSRRKAPTR